MCLCVCACVHVCIYTYPVYGNHHKMVMYESVSHVEDLEYTFPYIFTSFLIYQIKTNVAETKTVNQLFKTVSIPMADNESQLSIP